MEGEENREHLLRSPHPSWLTVYGFSLPWQEQSMLDLKVLLQRAGVLTGKHIYEGGGGRKWTVSMQENLVLKI